MFIRNKTNNSKSLNNIIIPFMSNFNYLAIIFLDKKLSNLDSRKVIQSPTLVSCQGKKFLRRDNI